MLHTEVFAGRYDLTKNTIIFQQNKFTNEYIYLTINIIEMSYVITSLQALSC
jgi:hypothetical protein